MQVGYSVMLIKRYVWKPSCTVYSSRTVKLYAHILNSKHKYLHVMTDLSALLCRVWASVDGEQTNCDVPIPACGQAVPRTRTGTFAKSPNTPSGDRRFNFTFSPATAGAFSRFSEWHRPQPIRPAQE